MSKKKVFRTYEDSEMGKKQLLIFSPLHPKHTLGTEMVWVPWYDSRNRLPLLSRLTAPPVKRCISVVWALYYPGQKNWDNRVHVAQAHDLSSMHSPTAWCSEIASLWSLDAPELRPSSDVREPISLHQAVCLACVAVSIFLARVVVSAKAKHHHCFQTQKQVRKQTCS